MAVQCKVDVSFKEPPSPSGAIMLALHCTTCTPVPAAHQPKDKFRDGREPITYILRSTVVPRSTESSVKSKGGQEVAKRARLPLPTIYYCARPCHLKTATLRCKNSIVNQSTRESRSRATYSSIRVYLERKEDGRRRYEGGQMQIDEGSGTNWFPHHHHVGWPVGPVKAEPAYRKS